MLRALLYLSYSTCLDQSAEQEQLNNIRNTSLKTNEELNISGVLAYQQQKFLHILEGESHIIDSMLEKIMADKRTKNLSILVDITPEERVYSDWSLIESHNKEQSKLLGRFLQRSIDMLPVIDQKQHDDLEEFIDNIFY